MIHYRKRRPLITALCLAGCMLWAGCNEVSDDDNVGDGTLDDSDTNGTADLSGREFQATDITENGTPLNLVDDTTLVIAFGNDGTLSVHAGCNQMGGAYEIEAGVLETGAISSTMMGCDEALHDQDNWVSAILGASPTIARDGDTITLTAILDDDTTVVIALTDADVLSSPLPLVGTNWTVTTVINGETAKSAALSEPATIVFGDDGVLDVYTGCNSGSGDYTVAQDAIDIEALAVTEMACADPDRSQLEADVLSVLNGTPLTFEIQRDRLHLSSGSNALRLQGDE